MRLLHIAQLSAALVLGSVGANAAETQTAPSTEQAPAPKHRLRHLFIAESQPVAEQLAHTTAGGFVRLSPALARINLAELSKRVAEAENQFIEARLLIALGQAIEAQARQDGFPNATTIIPTQNVADGAVRVILYLNPPLIRQILIADGIEEAQQMSPAPERGFVVLAPSLAFLKADDLSKRLAAGENKPFNEKLVVAISQVIEGFIKQSDLPAATAVIPPQDASGGVLRIAIHRGKIRNIKITGNRWFSESLLREKLRIEQGETVRLSELDQAISWTNNNPFRRVRVQLDPVATTGEVDLVVAVQESLPLRVQGSYDNNGNDIVGNHRFVAAASYANLWGRDHQMSYQLITTDLGLRIYQGHGFDYRLPLPWRDQLQLSGSYLLLKPSILDGLLTQEGESINASLRYTHPIRMGDNPIEVYGGVEFKRSNNNLLFIIDETSSVPVLTNETDIFQFTFGGSILRRDKRGAWVFGANINFSPGRLSSRNSDVAFESSRPFARSRYAYAQLTFQRVINLYRGWDYLARGVVQYAPRNLLPGEQMYVGGASSVRGFRENVFGGDSGFVFGNELLTPSLQRKIPGLPQGRNVLETRFLGFFDLAHAQLRERTPTDPNLVPLASAGIGLRANIATNFSLTADYGWQITRLPFRNDDRSRGHIKATLAF